MLIRGFNWRGVIWGGGGRFEGEIQIKKQPPPASNPCPQNAVWLIQWPREVNVNLILEWCGVCRGRAADPACPRRSPNAGLMLGQRRRRWPNINRHWASISCRLPEGWPPPPLMAHYISQWLPDSPRPGWALVSKTYSAVPGPSRRQNDAASRRRCRTQIAEGAAWCRGVPMCREIKGRGCRE